ncbi:MAG TPA: flagellar biosynthetic protein FliO [Pelagibacterium sp.]|uniref:flagellar biosynthetic protein FliO n=1 Tax=Pelagibacterium sp. TaxID=1967288 RepID=UPI002B92902F|nr:flagellar biosynthetic protein FliO [Pelagibacterium sp.]HWJ88371.1 flagellar biosynthetic protein FliO [Pelagibacterium sp.]
MGFLTSLFGGETNYLTMIIALAIVLVLIVLAVWLIKLVGDASRSVGRGRNRRLMIVDSIAIDNKRQAVIVRRDETEHLIVIGGPNDLVVESGFAAPAAHQMQRVQRRKPVAESAPSVSPEPVATPARPAGTSLRHTGLLRAVDDEPDLLGGKPDNPARSVPDSATSVSVSASSTVDSEPRVEARDDHFEDAASRS